MSKPGSVDLASHIVLPYRLIARPTLRRPTRDECDMQRNDVHPSTSSYTSSMGRRYSSILASVFSPLFSRTFSFDTCLHLSLVFSASAFPLSSSQPSARPGLFFILGLQASLGGTACRAFSSGQTQKDRNNSLTATRRAHSVGILFNVVGTEAHFFAEPWHATSS